MCWTTAHLTNSLISAEYGLKHDIKYNASKSAVLICRTKQDKRLSFPPVSGNILDVCRRIKYLGHLINDQVNDDDVYRQCCKLYTQANTIDRKFSFWSTQVKVALFKAYCTPLYCVQLCHVKLRGPPGCRAGRPAPGVPAPGDQREYVEGWQAS